MENNVTTTKAKTARKVRKPQDVVPDEAMEKLIRIMNDSPTILTLKGTKWEIRGLKPGTQWMIAEEACKIVKNDNMAMGDVIKGFSLNMPCVCRVLALAMLNDKERINNEYQELYDTLMWGDYEVKDWAKLLFEVLQLIDVDFFFASTNVIATFRSMTLQRKMTMTEQKSL